jgi:DNA (cytosine-5)-methyltransferase 1
VSPTLNASENHSDVRATVLTVMGDVTHTLTSEGSDGIDGSEDGTGRGTPIVAFSHTAGLDLTPSEDVTPPVMAGHDRMPSDAGHAVVRRLTPMECERLQGFPDGWTDIPGTSDSARYRQMGNAVTIQVIEWIGHRIVAVEAGDL